MKTNIGVFFGGRSTEHEISVISAHQAMAAIDTDRFDVTPIYISKQGKWYMGEALNDLKNFRDMPSLLSKLKEVYMRPIYDDYNVYGANKKLFGGNPIMAHLDVVIPVLHGSNGEDGTFQGIIEAIGIPYAGCNVLSSANGMDKITMKMILSSENIPVVDYYWFTDHQFFDNPDAILDNTEKKLGDYPYIVKPANLGSSVGIGRAADRAQLKECIENATKYSTRIIVEHMVDQLQEINCSVLGDQDEYRASVLEEPIKSGEILSYQDKYMGGTKTSHGMQSAKKRIPADLPDDVTKRIQFLASETFRVLSCHGVARVDMIIDRSNGNIYVNEINTIPGSLSYYLWEASGISFKKLMDQLVALALKRKRHISKKTVSYDQNIFSLTGAGTKGGVKGGKLKG